MATSILNDIIHYGNKVISPDLKEATIAEGAATNPKPRQLTFENGVVHYRDLDNVLHPVHENAIRKISDPRGIITATVNNYEATLQVADASPTLPGFLSTADKSKLDGATSASTPGTLVIRDASGAIVVTNVSGLPATPADPTSAASMAYVDAEIASAISTANTNLQAIQGAPPIVATPNNGSLTISINPATATTPGSMSANDKALLDGATSDDVPGTLIRRGDVIGGDSGGQIYGPTVIHNIQTSSIDVGGLTKIQGNLVQTDSVVSRFGRYEQLNATTFAAINATASSLAVTNVNPNDPSSATNVGYVTYQIQNAVRDAIAGMDRKAQGVRVALDTNTALTSTFGTFGGVAIASTDANKSILLFNQANPAENGPYDVTANGLVRRADSNSTANLTTGATYQVETGDYANHLFTLVTQDGFTLGSDPLTFLDISGVNVLRKGNAIDIVNQTINVIGTPDRIITTGGGVDIAPNYIGQTSITTLGGVTTGTWSANTIAIQYGGTGATTIEQARINLEVAEDLRFVLGDGAATQFTITHNLGNSEPDAYGYYNGKKLGEVDFDVIDENTIRVNASLGGTPVATNSLVIHVVGKKKVATDLD